MYTAVHLSMLSCNTKTTVSLLVLTKLAGMYFTVLCIMHYLLLQCDAFNFNYYSSNCY